MRTELASLPLTEGTAMQHLYRGFHQKQLWQGNELPPELWSWKRKLDHTLVSITIINPVVKISNL